MMSMETLGQLSAEALSALGNAAQVDDGYSSKAVKDDPPRLAGQKRKLIDTVVVSGPLKNPIITVKSNDASSGAQPLRQTEGGPQCRIAEPVDLTVGCADRMRLELDSKDGTGVKKEAANGNLVQRRAHRKHISLKYKMSVGWQPAQVVWKPAKVKTIESSVFLSLLYLQKFVRESFKRKPYAADLFAGIKLEVISTPKLMKQHLKGIIQESKLSQNDTERLKLLLRQHRALILCFFLQGESNSFKLDMLSTSPFEVSCMYKDQVSRSTENLFLTSMCSCGHPSHTPRLTIALKLMNEVIAAATISVFTVHFRGQGRKPMVVLEILGLAVKKGDLMGKGLGRLMISYLRHLAHRLGYDLKTEIGMITKTSSDSAAWWASVPSFYSFREASKKFDEATRDKWKTVLKNSQSQLHMFYSHFNLTRSYLWAPELDKPSEMESLDITYLKVLRRIVDVVASRGAPGLN